MDVVTEREIPIALMLDFTLAIPDTPIIALFFLPVFHAILSFRA